MNRIRRFFCTTVATLLFGTVFSQTALVTDTTKRNWYDSFEGVLQNDTCIKGFVGDYKWLSNYESCRVAYEGRVYGSSEAAYHASKYPSAERDTFILLSPDDAKKLSRKKGVDKVVWDKKKEQVMREITLAKFSQNPELAAELLATGDRYLEETNWWGDQYWGVFKGTGKNRLGQILMDIRKQLALVKALPEKRKRKR